MCCEDFVNALTCTDSRDRRSLARLEGGLQALSASIATFRAQAGQLIDPGGVRGRLGASFSGSTSTGEGSGSAPAGGGDAGTDAIARSLADVGERDRRMRLPSRCAAGPASRPPLGGRAGAAAGWPGMRRAGRCGPGQFRPRVAMSACSAWISVWPVQASRCRWLASRRRRAGRRRGGAAGDACRWPWRRSHPAMRWCADPAGAASTSRRPWVQDLVSRRPRLAG